MLISDLLDDPDAVVKGLKHLRFRGTDVIVFQLLDPHELHVSVHRARRASRDVESAAEVTADPSQVRAGVSARRWRACARATSGSCAAPASTS